MLAPYTIQILLDEGSHSFISTSFVTIFIGVLFILANLEKDFKNLTLDKLFYFLHLLGLQLPLLEVYHLFFQTKILALVKHFLKSMSGITTTGATIISDLDNSPIFYCGGR